MKPFFITTSIAYPNANPHIGYALELVQADFLARYYRLQGREVYLLTGLDEHGLKIQRTAEKAKETPQQFVNQKARVFEELCQKLKISQDRFIRTTDPDHQKMAQALWRQCLAKGDIYKKKYRAWYNVKEEEFLGIAEEGQDASGFGIDPQFVELIDEENYFFRLSRYKEQIKEILKKDQYKVLPEGRLQEIINFIDQKGLQDISISREAAKLSWGIPVPEDESQVLYVWFDALANYLTASCKVDGRGIIQIGPLWPADLHCIGKDISRFHALIWTGILLSADLPLPKELLIHGFLSSGGQKMSKSLGNVIDPFLTLEQFSLDLVRWYLLKEVSTTGDADFTFERLERIYLADLANDLGNLISRVWSMCQKYCNGEVPSYSQIISADRLVEDWQIYHAAVEERRLDDALRVAHQLIVSCNKRIDEEKPWLLAKQKERKADLDNLLYDLLETIRQLTVMLKPALLESAPKIAGFLFPDVTEQYWQSFSQASQSGILIPGSKLGGQQLILFPKPAL